MTDEHRRVPDTVVVGAGLAGLARALDLCRAGQRVALLEASDGVGGRMRTGRRDGFLPDRRFQVCNTPYPQVKRRLDLSSSALRPSTAGIIAYTPKGPIRLADPTREPGAAGALLPGRVLSARDPAAPAALTARDAVLPASMVRRRRDLSTAAALSRAGVLDAVIADVLRPFLSGVFLADRLETSARSFHLVWRSTARGPLCLPASGIGAVPAQLAGTLPEGVLRLGTSVEEITDAGVLLRNGSEVPARAVVVATAPATAARMLPDLTVPDARTVTTYHHATESTPMAEPPLMVDSTGTALNACVLSEVSTGTALNTCVLSEVAHTYAPPRHRSDLHFHTGNGRPAPGTGGAPAPGRAVRHRHERLAADRRLHGRGRPAGDASPWPLSHHTRLGPGRYVCGDSRATGSVRGALASGARAAREVSADSERRR